MVRGWTRAGLKEQASTLKTLSINRYGPNLDGGYRIATLSAPALLRAVLHICPVFGPLLAPLKFQATALASLWLKTILGFCNVRQACSLAKVLCKEVLDALPCIRGCLWVWLCPGYSKQRSEEWSASLMWIHECVPSIWVFFEVVCHLGLGE